jgi:Family of unknown function (DUF6232)
MVTYYQGPYAVVTSDVFQLRCPYHHAFAIKELRDVFVARGGPDPLAVGTTCFAGSTLVVVSASWPFIHSPVAWLGAVAFVVTPWAVSGACWRLRPPVRELWATYRHQRVQLFSCRDERMFGQVSRALLRALEASRDWRDW